MEPIGAAAVTTPAFSGSVRSYTWLCPLITRSTEYSSNSGVQAARTPPSEAWAVAVQ